MSFQSVVFDRCVAKGETDEGRILLCMANAFREEMAALELGNFRLSSDIVQWLLVLCGSLVFFMQVGFAMLCAGNVRKKNVVNTMLKNMLDCCIASLAYYMMGYAFAFGEGVQFIGYRNFFGSGQFDYSIWFFQLAFSATTVTIVAGTLAERCKMTSYFIYAFALAGFVYPVVVRAIWSSHGFLSAFAEEPLGGIGVVDFAGSGVVHCTGGVIALIATIILGPRHGRFYNEKGEPLAKPNNIQGHSMALQLLGTITLWFGWYGFNCGSALLLAEGMDTAKVASRVAVNTTLSAACGALSALFTEAFLTGRIGEGAFSLPVAMNGALTGLVGITAGCGTMEMWSSSLVGILCGWLYMLASWILIKLRIDDAVEAVPVHLFGGSFGLIATGIFSSSQGMMEAYGTDEYVGLWYAIGRDSPNFTLLRNQIYALLFILGWSTFCMFPFFSILNAMGLFRATKKDEIAGLDVAYHQAELTHELKQELLVAEANARQRVHEASGGPSGLTGNVVRFAE